MRPASEHPFRITKTFFCEPEQFVYVCNAPKYERSYSTYTWYSGELSKFVSSPFAY